MLILLALVLGACAPLAAELTPGPVASPLTPTELPAATIPHKATSTPIAPEGPYATEQAAREQRITTRATASPFPTARPVRVKQGAPASAIAQRDGLILSIELPKDRYLAGKGGQVQITLRNGGPETLFILGAGDTFPGDQFADLILLDEQGHQPPPYPWSLFDGPRPPALQKLAPGESFTAAVKFQVPVQIANDGFSAWALTRYSRSSPEDREGPDNIWLRLETGPVMLHLATPNSSQQLRARLEADRHGWRLKVTDAHGQPPHGPLWGTLEGATSHSFTSHYNSRQAQRWTTSSCKR